MSAEAKAVLSGLDRHAQPRTVLNALYDQGKLKVYHVMRLILRARTAMLFGGNFVHGALARAHQGGARDGGGGQGQTRPVPDGAVMMARGLVFGKRPLIRKRGKGARSARRWPRRLRRPRQERWRRRNRRWRQRH